MTFISPEGHLAMILNRKIYLLNLPYKYLYKLSFNMLYYSVNVPPRSTANLNFILPNDCGHTDCLGCSFPDLFMLIYNLKLS